MVTLALHVAERQERLRAVENTGSGPAELNPLLARLRQAAERITAARRPAAGRQVATGLPALDELLSGGVWTGATYELAGVGGAAATWALALHTAIATLFRAALSPGRSAREPDRIKDRTGDSSAPFDERIGEGAALCERWLIWIDPAGELYPPAAAAMGAPLERLLVLRAPRAADVLWATEQALRCRAVAAVVAPLRALDVQVSRRLQLAAEEGGGVGLLLREGPARGQSFAAGRLACEPAGGTLRMLRARVTVQKLREAAPGATALVEIPLVRNAPHHASSDSSLRPAV